MRFVNLYVRTTALAWLLLAASGCQTAQKPVALMPAKTAPAVKPAPAPASAAPQPEQAPAPTQQEDSSAQKPASTEAAPAQAAAASDPVADLVDRAEKEYQAGLTNYHAGKTDEARQNFDRALNALLSSNLDIRSDDRLEKELDHIVQGVNEIYPGGTSGEAEAAQEPQQKSEPAPIDTTNEIAPAADAST
jgi:membrane-bound lytic murein transglycosylase D